MKNFLRRTSVLLLCVCTLAPLSSMAYLIPSSVNFGRIPCNSTGYRSVTFVNSSNQTLQNVSISVSGIAFFASGFCPFNMAPNSSCSINVNYQPRNQPGGDFATLWVNAYPLGGDTASLSGSCYIP